MMTGELAALKAAARQRLAAGQGELDLGLRPDLGRRVPVGACRMPGQQAGAAAREMQNTICKTATGYSTSEMMR